MPRPRLEVILDGLMSHDAAGSDFVPAPWVQLMPTAPALSSTGRGWRAMTVYRFPYPGGDRLELPPLRGHFISVHMNGACRLRGQWNGQVHEARSIPGRCIIVAAHQSVTWQWDGAFDEVQLVIDPRRFEIAAAEISDRPFRLLEGIGIHDPFIQTMARRVVEELANETDGPRGFGDALADTLIWHVLRRHSTLHRRDAVERLDMPAHKVRRAVEFIASNAARELSVDDMAAAAGMSASRFARGFKRATGESPYQYLLGRRIELAQDLLRNSDLPLAEIAAAVGFATQSQFTAAFRRRCRVAPGCFRRQYH